MSGLTGARGFDGLLVDHAGLDAGAADLARGVRAIEERLQRLEGELGELREDWVGSAQEAYLEAKARWDASLREMKDLLARTGTAVAEANAEYAAADRRGAALFR